MLAFSNHYHHIVAPKIHPVIEYVAKLKHIKLQKVYNIVDENLDLDIFKFCKMYNLRIKAEWEMIQSFVEDRLRFSGDAIKSPYNWGIDKNNTLKCLDYGG